MRVSFDSNLRIRLRERLLESGVNSTGEEKDTARTHTMTTMTTIRMNVITALPVSVEYKKATANIQLQQ
jgi:hypothetical protein